MVALLVCPATLDVPMGHGDALHPCSGEEVDKVETDDARRSL